ncbi:enoyl-CoA hydratase/isomerase [Tepidicaulis marinus]|uniref:Enoyl-CoA hydratase/isomerase n=1 Tax=Tepidicaulis marinus TaxID=1333998 RepID=A0A081BDD1_9HYPH|nr:crotonase/enoyl-CoA hydratase family protein [Tepidicaulis marinus]GAK46049.1 enoyl-CoA hydratase/isomerase [Tepidicaulis marinus]
MSDNLLSYEVRNGVAEIRMDDGRANALGHEMIGALNGALDKAEKEASAILLSGREGRFCAGFDLSVMSGGPLAVQELVGSGAKLLTRLYMYPLPVITACTGHALAAGGLLLLASDYRIGAEGTFKIGLNEVAIGMTTPLFLLHFARDRVPAPLFDQATVHARIFDPESAVAAGFLDETAAPDALMSTAAAKAEAMGALPRAAFSGSKRKAHGPTVRHIEDTLSADSSSFDGAH